MARLLKYISRKKFNKGEKMYPNSNIIRNTNPAYSGIANYNNIKPTVEEKKEENFESIYGIFDEELDSIDLSEFISPGFISFPGKNGGFYGQDPTQDPNTPQPGQPGKPNQPGRQQPEIPNPNDPQAPPEHPGQVQPDREIDRPTPPVVPPTQPPTTPQHGLFH